MIKLFFKFKNYFLFSVKNFLQAFSHMKNWKECVVIPNVRLIILVINTIIANTNIV